MKKKATEQSMRQLADAAFKQAAKKVIEIAERTGTPVIIWEDGMVKRVEPRKSHRNTHK
jgi:hypothetical protein